MTQLVIKADQVGTNKLWKVVFLFGTATKLQQGSEGKKITGEMKIHSGTWIQQLLICL